MKITTLLGRNAGLDRILSVFSSTVVLLVSIPLFYLVIRTYGTGPEILDIALAPKNIAIFINSIVLATLVTTFSALIAVPLAFLTVRTDLPWKRFWSIATALPLVIPSYVGSFVIISAIGPKGSMIHNLLKPLGVEGLPSIYGLPGAVLALTLFSYPYILLTVRSSLQNLDPSLEEAARNMGCSRWETFVRVTLPHIKPSIAAGGLLVALYSLSDFGTPSLMRFDSFTRAIFIQYQSSFDRSTAAVLAMMLVLLAFVILVLEYRSRARVNYHGASAVTKRPLPIIELGIWRTPALIFTSIVVLFALIMPLGVIVYWLFRGSFDLDFLMGLFKLCMNSVYVSGLTAVAAIIAALPVSIYAVRYPRKLSNMLERATYLGSGLPGVVVALSLVFFGANFATGLYQTTAMLIFAYVVLFLPKAVGTVRSSLLQVNPRLEEAARSLGSGPLETLEKVTIPLVRPGLVNGAALVFLTTMKELPATLILSPIGFQTLATRIWAATDDAFYAEAAVMAIFLIIASGLSMSIILKQEKAAF
ncbi:iron ABC transporter permease [Methanolobus sp. WCC4]|uniref:ABC transporter permease n=1 Tax=Methanolobus sp. WCC4 TaxID=3125784 RepID=UPI0030FB3353